MLPRRPLRSLSTLLAALFAPYPLLASVNGLSAELQRTATELLREPWDVVQYEHSYSFQPYERPLRDAGQPFVLTEHNVESSSVPPPTTACRAGRCPSCATTSGVTAAGNAG